MKIINAKRDQLKEISNLIKILDTENYEFSNKKEILEYIKKGFLYAIMFDKKIVAAMQLELDEGSYEIGLLVSNIKGGGKALIEFAVNKCKKEKIPKIWCWSLKRYNAEKFYEKMGFNEIHLLKNQFYGEDCYFLGKVISIGK